MKIIALIICAICFSINAGAQRKLFLRVYGNDNQKVIAKGFYAGTEDSSVLLIKRKDTLKINYRHIGFYKNQKNDRA